MTATLKEPAATVVVFSAITVAVYVSGKVNPLLTNRMVVLSDHWALTLSGKTASTRGGSKSTWRSDPWDVEWAPSSSIDNSRIKTFLQTDVLVDYVVAGTL